MYGYMDLKADQRKYQPGELRRGLLMVAAYYLDAKKVTINRKIAEIVKLLASEILSLFHGLIELGRIVISSSGQEDSNDSSTPLEREAPSRPP